MTRYYPSYPSGAFTGFMYGGNPYVPGGGYSTGAPAGYGMPLPTHFSESPDSSWMTQPEEQFERRHLDHEIDATVNEWTGAAMVLTGAFLLGAALKSARIL